MYHCTVGRHSETSVRELPSKWNPSGNKNREGKKGKKVQQDVKKNQTFGSEIH
jgi:hypothetical protein